MHNKVLWESRHSRSLCPDGVTIQDVGTFFEFFRESSEDPVTHKVGCDADVTGEFEERFSDVDDGFVGDSSQLRVEVMTPAM